MTGDMLRTIQRHGYLLDWDQERWERAEQELAQARLLHARQRHQAMAMMSIQGVIEENIYEGDEHIDGG